MPASRRRLLGGLLVAPTLGTTLGTTTLGLWAGRIAPAAAQTGGAAPIRVIVPNAAGGVADLTARTVGQAMAEKLRQPVVIDNRPGAGGIVAGQALLGAAPDGSTLMVATNANAISRSLFRHLPFDPIRDFAPVGLMGSFSIALLVAPNSPIRDVDALLRKLKADPAGTNIGTISVGSTQNLAAELFRISTGLDATIVPFSGTPALLTGLLRGDVTVAFEIVAPLMGQLKDGSLRAIAVTSAARAANLPEVPTLREAADIPGLRDFDVTSWNALVAPARTPEPAVARLNGALNEVLADAGIRRQLLDAGVEAHGGTPAALGQLMEREAAKWARVIEQARIERQ
ncbi:tripartite tricarboxylate transporter substrate-binding protein [Roseomonas sp. NAR14]|uniref:Tripartite tricarboxylate transporter substrate-binding protein n=1 Tax=Roseomonas acroporae TaxID=2937791 RepID=A0A9X2BWP0_9PROT|nr:tripartite tricarboxylate transporter substrate-binding protein [Roseomonas acroporae]MCK8786266.1 tripartite tricarboxylate transporter substrate-binding protein [Roseomonas acroporae]